MTSRIPLTFMIALPIVILGMIFSFLGRYPILGSAIDQGQVNLTTVNYVATLHPPELPENVVFREVYVNLTTDSYIKINISYGKVSKTLSLMRGKVSALELNKAVSLTLILIEGSGRIYYTYTVKYESYPFIWLSLPALFLAFLGLALIMRGFIELLIQRE